MKLSVFILRFIVISVIGVLSHFLYEWSGANHYIGYISAVNESTWEHLKIFFFPFLYLTVIEVILCRFHKLHRNNPADYLSARLLGMLNGMTFIVVSFYVFWGISGKLIDVINISLYFVGVIIALYMENRAYRRPPVFSTYAALLIISFFFLCFVLFTYHAPELGLFYDLAKHPASLFITL